MSDKEQLLSFGFSEIKVAKALKATRHSGLQPALDWLLAHADDADDAEEVDDAEPEAQGTSGSVVPPLVQDEARSLKCADCGKMFRSTAAAEFHATKSGHENFEESTEEIKPLTEEEKKAKLDELRAQMAVKRAAQAKLDAEEAKKNEAIRRKAGKDTVAQKEALKLKEAENAAAARKREKQEDAEARARIKKQIEEDKKARAEKAAREKALRDGVPLVDASASQPSGPSTVKATPKSTAATARLQIRLPDDSAPLTTTLRSSETLQSLITWVEGQRPDLVGLKYSTTFPRKQFGGADVGKTLGDLGLSPSAVLLAQR